MKDKLCSKCKKPVDGKKPYSCKECENKRRKDYIARKKADNPEWKQIVSKEKKRQARKNYCLKNPDKIKKYYQDNKLVFSEKGAARYKTNKEIILATSKKWQVENKERFYELRKKAIYKFRKNNPHIVAWQNMLHRTLRHFGVKKETTSIKLLGYSAEQLRFYIEVLFTEGMSWDNYGEWQIDHIKPVTLFANDTHVSIVNALKNLQPLWKIDNIKKRNKYPIMEKETFIQKLTSSNTRISGIQEYLKLLPSMDLDDTSIEGTFEFALIPDYRSYGLDGITVKVKRCQVEVRWSMEVEFLSPEELVSAIGAGGVESNSGSIEGTFSLDVAENDESWAIGTDEITFSKKGAISICQVEFQLTNIGKNYLIIS